MNINLLIQPTCEDKRSYPTIDMNRSFPLISFPLPSLDLNSPPPFTPLNVKDSQKERVFHYAKKSD